MNEELEDFRPHFDCIWVRPTDGAVFNNIKGQWVQTDTWPIVPLIEKWKQPETMTITGSDQNGKEVVETGVKICPETGRKDGE